MVYLFELFVTSLFNNRASAKKEGNDALSYVYKILMNSNTVGCILFVRTYHLIPPSLAYPYFVEAHKKELVYPARQFRPLKPNPESEFASLSLRTSFFLYFSQHYLTLKQGVAFFLVVMFEITAEV